MKIFFKDNKTVLAILVGVLILGGVFIFLAKKTKQVEKIKPCQRKNKEQMFNF